MENNDNLSQHFSLHEMLASQTATRTGITEQFSPGADIIESLKYLCNNLLEEVRVLNNNQPIHISSGYRCPRLNSTVGGASNSQHMLGQAADIDFGSVAANQAFFEKIKNSVLVFDQLLNEYNFAWVHVSIKQNNNRKQVINIT